MNGELACRLGKPNFLDVPGAANLALEVLGQFISGPMHFDSRHLAVAAWAVHDLIISDKTSQVKLTELLRCWFGHAERFLVAAGLAACTVKQRHVGVSVLDVSSLDHLGLDVVRTHESDHAVIEPGPE